MKRILMILAVLSLTSTQAFADETSLALNSARETAAAEQRQLAQAIRELVVLSTAFESADTLAAEPENHGQPGQQLVGAL